MKAWIMPFLVNWGYSELAYYKKMTRHTSEILQLKTILEIREIRYSIKNFSFLAMFELAKKIIKNTR